MTRVRPHFEAVDEIWHAGDWQYEEVLAELAKVKPLTVVNGNAPDDPRYPEYVKRTIEDLEVGMVHRPPRFGDAWADALDICIHGHTHRWRDDRVDGVRLINVSTPTLAARDERTIAILSVDGREARLRKVLV